MIMAFSVNVNAEEVPREYVQYYMQDKNIVLQILGASKWYVYRCGPLTNEGEIYKSVAIDMHQLDESEIKHEDLFQQGFLVATSYASCEALWDGLQELGIGFLFTKPNQNELA